MFYRIMLVWYNYKHDICNCSSLHLMTAWLSGKADHMDLIWCCMYFKESITILISANSSSIYNVPLKTPLVLLCMESTALTVSPDNKYSAQLPFVMHLLLNISPCAVYYVHLRRRRNNYVEYSCWLNASSSLTNSKHYNDFKRAKRTLYFQENPYISKLKYTISNRAQSSGQAGTANNLIIYVTPSTY